MEQSDKNQMDIDDCLIHDAKKAANEADGHPYLGPVDWPKMVLDMIRIIDRLKKEKEELRESILRNAK